MNFLLKFRKQKTIILEFTTQHHQIGLTLLSGIGSKRARLIISHFSDLEAFYKEKKLNISEIPGIEKRYASFKQRQEALESADAIINELEKTNSKTVFFTDKNFPSRLKHCQDAPLLLYTTGNFEWENQKIVSIVGTRHASEYGKELTHELIVGLSEHKATIVSGMAYGIDIYAHQFAVKNGLPTWGVLGHGTNFLYPSEHKNTAKRMLENGGLISEFFPSQKPEPQHFPMRNRIVAGLSDCTIVVESGEKGGSLITAKLAVDYNRELFAYPGDVNKPYSKGCLDLIKNNQAQLITESADVIRLMNWEMKNTKSGIQVELFPQLEGVEATIVEQLRTDSELSIDTLSYSLKIPVSEISSRLFQLEMRGLVLALPGRRYKLAR
ncbi:MAG: DNA-processing protein DprA [Fluviicola sp.]|jgi:DNA processing protein